MSTPTFDSLRQTLQHLRRRRSNLFLLKMGSWFAIALTSLILASSLIGVWLDPGKAGSILLFSLTVIAGVGLLFAFFKVLQRRHTDDRVLAHYVEDRIPDFEQRLLTSLEFSEEDLRNGREGVSQQFIQQLWQDAQVHVQQQQHEVETVTPARESWISFGSAVALVLVVAVLFVTSDSLLRSGTRLAWPFAISEPLTVVEFLPDIEISVEPGDLEMQRGESVTIIARVSNATPDAINLRLQNDNVNWRDVSMSRDGVAVTAPLTVISFQRWKRTQRTTSPLMSAANRAPLNTRSVCLICRRLSKSIWHSIIQTTPASKIYLKKTVVTWWFQKGQWWIWISCSTKPSQRPVSSLMRVTETRKRQPMRQPLIRTCNWILMAMKAQPVSQ